MTPGNRPRLERLVKHHSAEALVRSRELGHLGQGFVERDVKQLALAPLLTVGGALAIAGRYARPLSSLIERKLGHRTLTHSFLGLGVVAAAASPLLLVAPGAWAWLLVGALSHVLLNTANITGVPLLWPARIEFVLVHNRGTRVPYSSPREHWWFATFVLGALLLAPLARDGLMPWFHRLLATPTGAVQDYLRWRDRYEVWVDVRGHNLLTGEVVDGAYRVIDALHPEQLVVEDESGRAYRVGLRADSDITVDRVAARRGEPIVARTDRFEVGGRMVAELLAALPRGTRRVYVTGTLVLHGDAPELPAVAGWLRRVKVSKGETQVRAAAPSDLAGLWSCRPSRVGWSPSDCRSCRAWPRCSSRWATRSWSGRSSPGTWTRRRWHARRAT